MMLVSRHSRKQMKKTTHGCKHVCPTATGQPERYKWPSFEAYLVPQRRSAWLSDFDFAEFYS